MYAYNLHFTFTLTFIELDIAHFSQYKYYIECTVKRIVGI